MPIGVNLSYQPAKFVSHPASPPGNEFLSNSKSPLKRTNEFFSPLERTLALRQGFQPLPDYGFYLKLTPMGNAVSLRGFIDPGCTSSTWNLLY